MWQNLMEDELVEMPSYNLAETVYNKWLQKSGKRSNDFMWRQWMSTIGHLQKFLHTISSPRVIE